MLADVNDSEFTFLTAGKNTFSWLYSNWNTTRSSWQWDLGLLTNNLCIFHISHHFRSCGCRWSGKWHSDLGHKFLYTRVICPIAWKILCSPSLCMCMVYHLNILITLFKNFCILFFYHFHHLFFICFIIFNHKSVTCMCVWERGGSLKC